MACSHGSYLDGPIIGQALWPRPQRIVVDGHFRRHPLYPFLWLGNCIWTGTGTVVAQCLRTLAKGSSVIIFPDGGRTQNQVRNPHKGAARIALSGKAPLIPVKLKDSHKVVFGHRMEVLIGPPIPTAGYDANDPADWQKVTTILAKRINGMD